MFFCQGDLLYKVIRSKHVLRIRVYECQLISLKSFAKVVNELFNHAQKLHRGAVLI